MIGGVGVLLGGVLELGSGAVIYRKANTHVQYTIYAMHTYDDMTCSCILKDSNTPKTLNGVQFAIMHYNALF